MEGYLGLFNGDPVVRLLRNGRDMELMQMFQYADPAGVVWMAPRGSVVNGASVPRVLWRIVGSPFVGRYRNASILHDVYCVTQVMPSPQVHRMWYWAMRAGGVGRVRAFVMWLGVRLFGPRFRRRHVAKRPV